MRYLALACDYDGTLAHHGRVCASTVAALERVRASGRRLLLVSGRELEDLQQVFDQLELFDRLVLENGALLYRPDSREERVLAEPPPVRFVQALRERGISPLSVGRSIVATWHPNETAVAEVIHDLGLELQVIFNKGAVMVLPSGVNKATGLRAALGELGLSPHNAVGVGDAENDHAFVSACECAVAVANALPALAERCDWVTDADHGAGVVELADRLLADDLAGLAPRLARHEIELGSLPDGAPLTVAPYGPTLLIAGTSGAGKSTLAAGVLERAAERGYQFCIVDPEGDYERFGGALTLGDGRRVPAVEEALGVLANPDDNLVVNLLALPLHDRPTYFQTLLAGIADLRARTGRPHWLLVDEAHHLLPAVREDASWQPHNVPAGLILLTVHPSRLPTRVLTGVGTAVVIGDHADTTLAELARALDQPAPPAPASAPDGDAVLWRPGAGTAPQAFTVQPSQAARHRHRRKYAQGELGPDKSFWFTGPHRALHLRAQNLMLFLQIGDGVDDATWLHHLRIGDVSRWLREAVKDADLADQVAEVERDGELSADSSRQRIRALIEARYTLPA